MTASTEHTISSELYEALVVFNCLLTTMPLLTTLFHTQVLQKMVQTPPTRDIPIQAKETH